MRHGWICRTFANQLRERRDGIPVYECDRCGHVEPIIQRSEPLTVTAPAHERYNVSKAPVRKLIRFGRKR